MREILFRGKRIDNDEWVYGFYTQVGEKYHYMLTGKLSIMGNITTFDHVLVIPSTVGQYTGLTDKNGKKIFEGDIVEFQDGVPDDIYHEIEITNRGVISFSSGQFYVTDRNVVDMDDLILYDSDFDGEVIGNVHDNMELLKGD